MAKRSLWIVIAILVLGFVFLILRLGLIGPTDIAVHDELNSEGIRPDVAAEIARTFSESERKRAATTQLARSLQMAIAQPEEALKINAIYERAQLCLDAIEGLRPTDPPTYTNSKIEGWVVNSKARARAYIRYNSNLSGHIFKVPSADISMCDFDPSRMRN